jgi:hypothetical protein
MPKPTGEFEIDLPVVEKIATQDLPSVANALRAPANVLTAHEGLEGPGRLQAVYAMEGAYAHFTDNVGFRQRTGCDRIEATAHALLEIVNLYRRTDGQA